MKTPSTTSIKRFRRIMAGPLILLGTLIFLELTARLLAATVFKKSLTQIDLRTTIERTYIQPVPPRKEDASFSMFAYGGSTIAGFPLPKVGLVSQLTYQLHHIFRYQRDIGVFNFGWSGYNSTMIRYMVNSTIHFKPDLLFIYCCHNEFVSPDIDLILIQRATAFLRDRSALFRLLLLAAHKQDVNAAFVGDEPIARKRMPYRSTPWYYRLKLAIFKHNIRALVDLARKNHIPILFSTAAANIADWPPASHTMTTLDLSDEYLLNIDSARAFLSASMSAEAKRIIRAYRKKDPQNAPFIYLDAQLAKSEGNWLKANALLEEAKEYDILPYRAVNEINDYIRSFDDGKTVWVVDSDKLLRQRSPSGLPGYNYFFDNVHPNIEGSYVLSQAIIDVIKEKVIVREDWRRDLDDYFSRDELLQHLDLSKDEELKLLLLVARYCIKNPFFNFDCAQKYLTQAKTISAKDPEISTLEAVIEYLKGDKKQALERLKQIEPQAYYNMNPVRKNAIPYILQMEKDFTSD